MPDQGIWIIVQPIHLVVGVTVPQRLAAWEETKAGAAAAATGGAREEEKAATDLAGNCAPCRKKTARRRGKEGPTLTCCWSTGLKGPCLPGESKVAKM